MDDAHKHGFDSGGCNFRCNSDGSVTVYAEQPGEVTLTPESWASIVASVSHHGEGHVAYQSAYRFHVGEEPPIPPPLNADDLWRERTKDAQVRQHRRDAEAQPARR